MKAIANMKFAEIAPLSGNKPKQLVIFLHGLGADCHDLIDLGKVIAKSLPDAQFISPNAPFACDMAPFGYQWFSMQQRDEASIYEGVKAAAPLLQAFIEESLKQFELTNEQLALVGFSQGTMMSLYLAPRMQSAPACVVGFSGALIGTEQLKTEILSKPDILLVHGDNDEVVPHQASQLAAGSLIELGCQVQTHLRKGLGHGIDPYGLQLSTEFLVSKLFS